MKIRCTITAIDAPTLPVPTGAMVEIVDRVTGGKALRPEMKAAPMRAVYLTGQSWDSSTCEPIVQSGDIVIVCTPEAAAGLELGGEYELSIAQLSP